MEKIRALIVDDEPIARRGIRRQLESESDVEIIGECTNGREAVAAIRRQAPDLVFLDVQMPLLSGFGVVEAVGVENLPAVVFVTAHDEHAIRAFEIDALDYVLKPIDAERFQKTLTRVRKQLDSAKDTQLQERLSVLLLRLDETKKREQPFRFVERVAIKKSGRVFFLNVEDIEWISAQGNYVQINAKGQAHLLRETMDGIAQKLDPAQFVRLRRSTIARIERIRELQPLFNGEYALILKDGTQLTSSRRYRKNLDILLKN